MKKVHTVVGFLIVFFIGFTLAKYIYHQPTKEFCFGTINEERPDIIVHDTCVNNLDPETYLTIDDILIAFRSAPTLGDIAPPEKIPDLAVIIREPGQGVAYVFDEVWFTEDGAIIGDLDYDRETILNAQHLPSQDVTVLKEFIESIKK